jgi:hypothetical protein
MRVVPGWRQRKAQHIASGHHGQQAGGCQRVDEPVAEMCHGRMWQKKAGFMRLSVCRPEMRFRVVIHFQFCVQFAELEIGNQAILG